MANLGLLAINIPKKYGGSGFDTLGLAVAVEEISRGCGSTGSIISIHNCLYMDLINKIGNERQKEEFLTPFTNGSIGCFALSEPGKQQKIVKVIYIKFVFELSDSKFWFLVLF